MHIWDTVNHLNQLMISSMIVCIRLMWRTEKKMSQTVYWNNLWIGHLVYVWLPSKLFGNCFLAVHLWMKKKEKKNSRSEINTHTCNGR